MVQSSQGLVSMFCLEQTAMRIWLRLDMGFFYCSTSIRKGDRIYTELKPPDDFTNLSVHPTKEEVLSTKPVWLRKNKAVGSKFFVCFLLLAIAL